MLLNGCGSGNNRVLEEVSEKVYAVEANANISIQNRDGAVSGLWLRCERDAGASS